MSATRDPGQFGAAQRAGGEDRTRRVAVAGRRRDQRAGDFLGASVRAASDRSGRRRTTGCTSGDFIEQVRHVRRRSEHRHQALAPPPARRGAPAGTTRCRTARRTTGGRPAVRHRDRLCRRAIRAVCGKQHRLDPPLTGRAPGQALSDARARSRARCSRGRRADGPPRRAQSRTASLSSRLTDSSNGR